MITLKSLEKTYNNDIDKKVVFKGFDFSIEQGDRVGLFGPNGSGKTTLLNIISGIDKEFRGHFAKKGVKSSYMHQDYNSTLLPWFTCEKNILLVRKYQGLSLERGKDLLKILSKKLNIDFSLKKYPFMLSGGQKQIVTLMRALISEPDLLLMDEPFSALDVEKRYEVFNVLKECFKKNFTVIICSHRGEDIKSLIDRAVVLEKSPTVITQDFSLKELGNKKFEDLVSKIRFRRKESEI